MSKEKTDRQKAIADTFKSRGIIHSLLTALRRNIKDVADSVVYTTGRCTEHYEHAKTWDRFSGAMYVFDIKCYLMSGCDICSAMYNARIDETRRKTLHFLDEVEHLLTFRPLRVSVIWPTNELMTIRNEDGDSVTFRL